MTIRRGGSIIAGAFGELPSQTGQSGKYLTTNGSVTSWSDIQSGSFRNIGEIVTSTIPLTDAELHLLDGALINGSGIYADFVDYIHNLFLSNYVNFWKCSSSQTEEIVWVRDNDITENTIIYSDTKGTVYQKEDYPKYVVHNNDIMYATMEGVYISIRKSSKTVPINMFTTEEEWQQSVTTYGVCGKFVYNIVNNTVRLPKITRFIEGTINVTTIGDLVEAGLPNITGDVKISSPWTNATENGALKTTAQSASFVSGQTSQTRTNYLYLDASNSNSIYGNSDTVQPQSIKVLYYIVIATSTKTDIEVNIDEITTDLNGKVNTDLSNINASQTAKETIIGWSMPDFTAGVSINFDSSMDYAAPCDGFICVKGNTVAADLYAPNGGGEVKAEYWFSQSYGSTCNPITKGYRCKYRSGSSSYSSCIFYPLKGV